MFNLLRRSRQRKTHKNKIYDVSDDEEATATATTATRSAESANSNGAECRYVFSAAESGNQREQRAAAPRRAVIEELEDFGSDDEETASVNLAKTAAAVAVSAAAAAAAAANGHSAISCRSDNLYINNIDAGVAERAERRTNDVDRAAVGHATAAGSQNEAATKNEGGQLIGSSYNNNIGHTSKRIGPIIDGNAQQLQNAGTVIQAKRQTTETETETETEIGKAKELVKYRQSKQSNEQKRLSRLSLGSIASNLQLTKHNNHNNNSNNSDQSSSEELLPKKRKTLQRSREFLSDIFMARGRNHQRQQRNQQQQQQQSQQQPASAKTKTVENADVIAIGQALTATPTATAAATATALAAAHLETNCDPATVSTNSYQMTMSNNSATKRQSDTKEHARERSNSAGQEQQLPLTKEQQQQQQHQQQQSDLAAQRDEFIQAADVVVCTAAAEDQQRSRSNSNSSSSSNSNSNNSNSNNSNSNHSADLSMGQTSAKPNESPSAHSSRASTPREFRESLVSEPQSVPVAPPRHKNQQQLPKITVVDCSSEEETEQSPREEVFYDFDRVNIEELHEAQLETLEDEVFAADIPTTIYQQANNNGLARSWTRLSNVKLENVQEEAESEPEDDELDEALELDCDELEPRATPTGSRQSASSERSALKSDSNLSSSYADSGIGIAHEQQLPPQQQQQQSTQQQQQQRSAALPLRMPFVRDANSTSTDCDYDCEEMLLQCDELDDEQQQQEHFSERLVCIESISLPDVVVESTTATSTTTTAAAAAATAATTTAATNGGCNINITNGAAGNSLGNVHFIPIHIEGVAGGSAASAARSRSGSPMQRSFDDSGIGRNSVEIVEDSSVLNNTTQETLELKKELKLQKARFSTQLEDAHRNVQSLETKVGDMQLKIQNLEQELSLKQWNVDRLQGELSAAQKDDEYVRKKLKLLEDEKIHLRHKYSDDEDEFRRKYDTLQSQYNELTEKYKETQSLANNLQTQLASAKVEVEDWRNEVNKIRAELDEQIRILKNALEYSEAERKICEDKWQKEFEMLRTHNREREETLMSDCEWQMRQMQRQCKDKLDKSNYERKQATAKAEELELELQSRRKEAENLRICQAQVKSLSGVVSEQERSIQTLMERIENLKGELEMANENLESQIEAVRKIKYQCDNAIYDKERQMIYRIDEVRNEAAAFWENKLYTEMTRLTNELESVYVDERRDALDKLQAEHIEELRALTNRYTANEDELRAEIDELHENLELKKQDFLALRERSDNALLQTRMHLDRADREYQNAMCREDDRRVELEEKLKKEFEAEKEEMEEKFRERLGQVKEEFAKELQLSTQDMVETHRKELETQRAKLQAEKDEALQGLVERHRAKIAAAEERMNDVELRHQRNLKDLKAAYDAEKAALDNRDISNANEIEQLHRKCRCLTNLFEEMRMRYERRDPRAEDLREISELRTRCDSQERDLFVLTDRLREMQIQMSELQQNGTGVGGEGGVLRKKPPSKTIPTSCDVIYEENEERESPEQELQPEPELEQEVSSEGDSEEQLELEPSDTESNHTIEVNQKNTNKHNDCINEDDAHMISAV